MGDLQVAIGTGGLDPKKHGCCLDLRLATISLDKKQCQSDKKPNNLHYIFESEVPQSPAEPLQNLIVQKKIAATCRRWVRGIVLGKRLSGYVRCRRRCGNCGWDTDRSSNACRVLVDRLYACHYRVDLARPGHLAISLKSLFSRRNALLGRRCKGHGSARLPQHCRNSFQKLYSAISGD